MDLIDAYNKADVGEFVGHPHPTDPTSGDIMFQKTATTNIKNFLTLVARNAAITDTEMADNSWYALKAFSISGAQIQGATLGNNVVDDGTYTTYELIVSVKMTNADYVKFLSETAYPLKEVALTCIAE